MHISIANNPGKLSYFSETEMFVWVHFAAPRIQWFHDVTNLTRMTRAVQELCDHVTRLTIDSKVNGKLGNGKLGNRKIRQR